MSVPKTTSPMTNSWSVRHKCTARWASGASGAPALGLAEPVASSGARRRGHGRSSNTHHPLANPAPRSPRSKSVRLRGGNVQEEGGRVSEGEGGVATTGGTRRTRRGGGRGRGSERGRETQLNAKTLKTGTKLSTGIAEARTDSRSRPTKAWHSSAQSLTPPHPSPFIPPILFFILIFPTPPPTVCPLNPSQQGCCCYLYEMNILFVHKRDGAHSATRLGPLWTLKNKLFVFYLLASTPSLPPLR